MTPQQRRQHVEDACAAIILAGQQVTFDDVAARTGLGRATLYRNSDVVDTSSFHSPTQSGAYPIALATYEIVCSKYADAAVGQAVRAFLQSTIGPGQASLTENNGYIALPADFQSKVSAAVNAIS